MEQNKSINCIKSKHWNKLGPGVLKDFIFIATDVLTGQVYTSTWVPVFRKSEGRVNKSFPEGLQKRFRELQSCKSGVCIREIAKKLIVM